ncbi:MAG: DUF86 domain-containing protein [Candidatus Bathyarchaeia archaeon]
MDAIKDIYDFTEDTTYEQFINDRKTLNAVVRSIEIIGEAAKQLPDPLKARYSELPWREITGMRDKLIHAYFGMDTETLWQTIKENIPPLKQTIQRMQKDQEKGKAANSFPA